MKYLIYKNEGLRSYLNRLCLHYSSPETLETLKHCEAQEWFRRYKDMSRKHGPNEARKWWLKTLYDLELKRGPEAVFDLRRRMNLLRKT
jgi:hypothetical protein